MSVQQDFDGLSADASSDEPGILISRRSLPRTSIIDLGDVAAEALQKYHSYTGPQHSLDRALQIINPVRRDAAGTRRGMARVVDDAPLQPPARIIGADDVDCRIYRPGGLDDVRVSLSW